VSRILVVDDEAAIRRVVRDALESAGNESLSLARPTSFSCAPLTPDSFSNSFCGLPDFFRSAKRDSLS
jgi:CheY-like chemotaxis protein